MSPPVFLRPDVSTLYYWVKSSREQEQTGLLCPTPYTRAIVASMLPAARETMHQSVCIKQLFLAADLEIFSIFMLR